LNTSTASDRELLLDAIRKYARNELLDTDREWDRSRSSVADILPELADMGLLSLTLSEEMGGMECDMRTYAAIIHELAYASPSTAVTVAVHSMVVKILGTYASAQWRDEWLGTCGSHESFGAFAISEADAGSDPVSSKTTADRVDGGFRINGSKMWITNGLHARWFVVLARTRPDTRKSDAFSALVVDGQTPGIERDEIHGKMGIRGSETAVIHFNDVFVPDHHLLGEGGRGLSVCLGALDEGRLGIAAQATGIAEACLDEMVAYANQREQFGKTIAGFQAIQAMVADSAVELEASRLLTDRASSMFDSGGRCPRFSAMAKLYASEAANRIAYRAVQIHGGAGFVNECRVEQLYRDARVTTIYEGTSEIQRHVIARELLAGGVDG
jgi:alkylation response protein AidB-like acyl-CoA dehydrogenase